MKPWRFFLLLGIAFIINGPALAAPGVPQDLAATITKQAFPPDGSTVAYDTEITYTLAISAPLSVTLRLYDPLDSHLAWGTFLPPTYGVRFDPQSHALTGTLERPTRQITLSYKVHLGADAPALPPVGSSVISNTAYLYQGHFTISLAQPSNTTHHAVTRRAIAYLPLLLRDFPPNQLPYAPANPTPPDRATDQDSPLTLQWSGGDPDGNAVTYDVYLDQGISTPQTKVCTSVTEPRCEVNVAYDATYAWQVIATDSRDGVTAGPVWLFTMRDKPLPAWLTYLNNIRQGAALPSVDENATWSEGCWLHARYMVKNDYIGHQEDPNNPWYTKAGALAASKSNTMVYSNVSASDEDAIDMWMEGPFHAVGIIDPRLHTSGFGSYREAIGTWQMGAALDVLRGLGELPSGLTFPVFWPTNDATMPLLAYHGYEAPDPLTSCSGYQAPSGPPIILQLGSGDVTPQVTGHSFSKNGTALEHCVFDETNYSNPDSSYQSLGRSVLGSRDAVVLMPRAPLEANTRYTVTITANGATYTWSFVTAATAQPLHGLSH